MNPFCPRCWSRICRCYDATSIVRTEVEPPKQRRVKKTVGGQHDTGITLAELRALVQETNHLPEGTVASVRTGINEYAARRFGTTGRVREPEIRVEWDEAV